MQHVLRGYAQALYELGYTKLAEELSPGAVFEAPMEKDAFWGKAIGAVRNFFRAKPIYGPGAKAMGEAEDAFAGVVKKVKPKEMLPTTPGAKDIGSAETAFLRRKAAPSPTGAQVQVPKGTARPSSVVEPPPVAKPGAPAGPAATGAPAATTPAATPPPPQGVTPQQPGQAPAQTGLLAGIKKHPYMAMGAGLAGGYGLGSMMSAGVQQPMGSPQQMYQQQMGGM